MVKLNIKPYELAQNLEKYLLNICRTKIHYKHFRKTGGPYFEEHCLKMANVLTEIVPRNHRLFEIVYFSTLLHDSVEDKEGLEVFDPENKTIWINDNKLYLNTLLKESIIGNDISYIVYKLTHRKWQGQRYFEHTANLCKFMYKEKKIREKDTLAAVIKDEGDKNLNLDPIEFKYAQTIENKKFEESLIRNANSYLNFQSPKFQKFILLDSIKEHGDYFLDWIKIREVMKKNVKKSLEITSSNPETIRKSDLNKWLSRQKGIYPILNEIIDDELFKKTK
ncbi:MAG: hypothetical protein WC755_07130 [Candidatus Woesearchaeota archaeon]|jgi:hypothetical protein